MKKAIGIVFGLTFILSFGIIAMPPLANAADINRYGTPEYWKWYNSTRIASGSFIVYRNSDGNVAEWTELYDAGDHAALTDDGDQQKYAAGSGLYEVDCASRYGSATWGDYAMDVTTSYNVSYPANLKLYLGVRVQVSGSFATNGYFFSNGGHSGAEENWAAKGLTWATTHHTQTDTMSGITTISVAGTGASTTVVISAGGTSIASFSGPSTEHNTGTIAVGYNYTSTFDASYFTFDDYQVTENP